MVKKALIFFLFLFLPTLIFAGVKPTPMLRHGNEWHSKTFTYVGSTETLTLCNNISVFVSSTNALGIGYYTFNSSAVITGIRIEHIAISTVGATTYNISYSSRPAEAVSLLNRVYISTWNISVPVGAYYSNDPKTNDFNLVNQEIGRGWTLFPEIFSIPSSGNLPVATVKIRYFKKEE